VAKGKKLAADLEDLWGKMEAQQAKSTKDIAELKRQLDDRQLALEQARKDKASTMLSLVGAGILAVGTLLMAFGHFIGIGKFNAAMVILCGIATVSLPWVFDSSFFPWVVGVTLAVLGIELAVVLWRKMTHKPKPFDIEEMPEYEDEPQPEDQPK
jgi:xanthine/uracil permease